MLNLSNAFENASNPTMRIDSSYFMKEFLSLPTYPFSIGEITTVRSGTTPPDRDDELKDGVALLKTVDIQNRPLASKDSENYYHISPEIAERMNKTRLEEKDVLINIVGATTDVVGRVALVPKDFPEANITQAMALIRTKNASWAPEVIFAFLLGKHGQSQVRRLARPTGQYNLNIPEVESIGIPAFSKNFSEKIKQLIEASSDQRELSRGQLIQAELLLSKALGLDVWRVPEALSYVRSSREVFAALRMDAEHFQPRFQVLSDLIDASGAGVRLDDYLLENRRGKQPNYETNGLPVVNSKHVLRNEVRLDEDNRFASFEDDSILIRTGDVLINGTGVGTIGRSAAYLHESLAIPDNHVTILRPCAGLDPVYLAVYLNSKAGQLQVEQRLRGSSGQIELYPSDIAEFRIWLAPIPLQETIRAEVEQSFAQRHKAASLLEMAKRAIEIAVDDDETSALMYLSEIS